MADPAHPDEDSRFFADLAELLGTPVLTPEECTAVLDLTRVVAHGSQRRFAPLTAYALALTLSAEASGTDRTRQVREALERLVSTIADDG